MQALNIFLSSAERQKQSCFGWFDGSQAVHLDQTIPWHRRMLKIMLVLIHEHHHRYAALLATTTSS